MICKHCGAKQDGNRKTCSNCGAPLGFDAGRADAPATGGTGATGTGGRTNPAKGRSASRANANLMVVSMECPQCGEYIHAEVAREARKLRCPGCGKLIDLKRPTGGLSSVAPIDLADEGEQVEKFSCPVCGASVSAGQTDCPICGARLAGEIPAGVGAAPAQGEAGPAPAGAAPHQGTTVIAPDSEVRDSGTVVVAPRDLQGARGAQGARAVQTPQQGTPAYGPVSGAGVQAPAVHTGATGPQGAPYAGGTWQPVTPQGGVSAGRVAPPPPPPARNAGKIVAAVVACVVVVAAVAAFALAGGPSGIADAVSGKTELTAAYASSDEVTVTGDTRVVPMLDAEQPVERYTVRVKAADDAEGAAQSIVDMPTLDVTGGEGFTMADFGELPAGTYWLAIVDAQHDDVVYDLPPLVYDNAAQGASGDAEIPDVLTVEPPAGIDDMGELTVRSKYEAFRDKLTGLVDTYGDASITVMQIDDGQYLAWVAGVSYAELVDFGDGDEYLVVAYCTDRSFATSGSVEERSDALRAADYGPQAADYAVEVWKYVEDSGSLAMVCKTNPVADDDGMSILEYVENPQTGNICLRAGGTDVNGSASAGCFGLNEDGDLTDLASGDSSSWPIASRALFVHLGVTQDGAADDSGTGETSCAQTAQTVKNLTAELATITQR